MDTHPDDGTTDGHIAFRTDLLPILIIEFEGAVDDEIFGQYLDTITAFTRKREHVAVIVKADGARHMTAAQKQLQTEWVSRSEVILRTYLVGIAFVASTAPMRIVLRALVSEYAREAGVYVTDSEDEAITWAEDRLKKAAIETPS